MGTCTATAQVLLLPARLAAHTPQLHHNNIIPTAIVPPEPEGFWLSSRTAQVSRKSNWCPSLDGSASDSGQDSPVLCLSNLRSKVEGWSLPHDELDKTNLDCVQWPREDISVMSFHAWPSDISHRSHSPIYLLCRLPIKFLKKSLSTQRQALIYRKLQFNDKNIVITNPQVGRPLVSLRVSPTSSHLFLSLYQRLFEYLDFLCVRLILIEDASASDPSDKFLYKVCRTVMKEHADLTLSIYELLGEMRDFGAACWTDKKLDFEGIERNRLDSYDEEHPVKLIYPHLNLSTLSIYLNGFPGLHTMHIEPSP